MLASLTSFAEGVCGADCGHTVFTLARTVGLLFLLAVIMEFIAVFAEQAGAAKKKEEGAEKSSSFGGVVLMVLSTLTPALLLLHAFFTTVDPTQRNLDAPVVRALAIGGTIGAVILGAILGRIVGSLWQGAAGLLKSLTVPLGLAAFLVTLIATKAAVVAVVEIFTRGYVLLPIQP